MIHICKAGMKRTAYNPVNNSSIKNTEATDIQNVDLFPDLKPCANVMELNNKKNPIIAAFMMFSV